MANHASVTQVFLLAFWFLPWAFAFLLPELYLYPHHHPQVYLNDLGLSLNVLSSERPFF